MAKEIFSAKFVGELDELSNELSVLFALHAPSIVNLYGLYQPGQASKFMDCNVCKHALCDV